jgi:NAD(P)H dehydrogenase (quinone)
VKIAVIYHSETGNTQQMAELIRRGCEQIEGVQARTMPVDQVDDEYVAACTAVILGSPTYEGSCTWQIKRYLDQDARGLAGKLCGVFCSQNWPGGGGASFAEMTIIAGLLVRGAIVYSGGIAEGQPYLHFGAVSARAPEEELYRERCLKLGENIARKAVELFSDG